MDRKASRISDFSGGVEGSDLNGYFPYRKDLRVRAGGLHLISGDNDADIIKGFIF
jgi:hypothetical protein